MSIRVESITIFLSMITYSSGICTRNSKFNEVVKDPRTIYLCETNSSCTKRFLQDRENYYGCLIKETNKVESFSIYIHESLDNNGSIVGVLVGDKWEKRKSTVHHNKIAYITTLLNPNEHFAVECGFGLKPARNQFPDLDQKKYQFPDVYKHFDNSINQLYHSQILDCVSDCKENPIKLVRLDKFKDHTKVIGNSIHVDYANDPHVTYQNLLRFSCGGSSRKNEVTMNFKYAEHYNISIWDSYDEIGKLKIYDLWERFHCRISFLIIHNNMPVTPLHVSNIFIYMKVSSGPYSRSGYLTAWETKAVVIDLNVSLFHQLDLMCYLGNHNGITDRSMKNKVWDFGVIETVTIKGKYETKLLYDDRKSKVWDTLEDGSVIKCDIDYLGIIATSYRPGEIRPFKRKEIRLSYINAHHDTYPLSRMIPLNPTKYTEIKYKITQNKKTYFFCFVDEYYSIPRFFKAAPPRIYVSIVNVFPPWNHTFSLPLFTYGCKSAQFVRSSWITSNPENKFDVIIENRSKSLTYLTISKNINKDKYLEFTCSAKSKYYGIETQSKQFKTIVNYQVRFNYKSKENFYLEGDSFGCIAVFNVTESTGNSGHIMPMPGAINCDGWINSTDTNTTVLVLRTKLVQCFGCCLTFINSKLVCANWEEIKIVDSYRFQWNADLKNLYSGDFLTCSVCLNFTKDRNDQACIGNNNRLTNVGMRIRYSSSKVIEYPCFPDRFELVIPNIENSVNKELINSSDPQINISCCFRDVIEITTVKLKSNIVFQWNEDFNKITPGKKLTCSVCHNLTNDNNHNSCTPGEKVLVNVGMDIHDSDFMIMHIPCSSDRYEISLPADAFFKSNIPPFQINLKCCYENISETMSFRKDDCTASIIYFVPANKVIFRVNDTVSCTTVDERCFKYLTPAMSFLKRDNVTHLHYYKFDDKDVGYRGRLMCVVTSTNDLSIPIIVQNQPYNLTIQFLKLLMVPGTNLTCTANGYPEPILSWIQITGADKFRVVKNSLLIRLLDVSGIYLAKCEARNYLGLSEKIVKFEVFNPKALIQISSRRFYVYVPLLSLTAIFAMLGSLILIFQESVFGVPLFSPYKAYPTKLDLSKRSNKNKAIPDLGRHSFIAHTERLIQNNWLNDDD